MAQVSSTIENVTEKLRDTASRKPGEGEISKRVEQITSRVPSMGFLGLAIGSMALSAGLALANKRELATFVGLWAPSILLIGVYNKLIKLHGSE